MILGESLAFPDPQLALPSGDLAGLVALGGDLSVGRLLLAYQRGIFPWTVDPVTWWSPDPRAIFAFGQFHLSRSFRRVLRRELDPGRARFRLTVDQAFQSVMAECAAPGGPKRKSTWISGAFREAYFRLHLQGSAHSVECWHDEKLVGGIYGVALGGLFAAESMFHREDDASKFALWTLLKNLEQAGFTLFDIQMLTPHTARLGGINIPRAEYLSRLEAALKDVCSFPKKLELSFPSSNFQSSSE